MGGDSPDVIDSRTSQRFIAVPPLEGIFGTVGIRIHNLAEGGVQAEHAEPLRVGVSGRLQIRIPGDTTPLNFRATVVWSHLSRTPDFHGKYLYRSGMRVEENQDMLREMLRRMVGSYARPEVGSLDRKRRAMLDRARRLQRTAVPLPTSFVSPDQRLQIQQARDWLRSNPDDAGRWYNRAKFSPVDLQDQALPDRFRYDILAVWEYLERSVDLGTIRRVFEENPK